MVSMPAGASSLPRTRDGSLQRAPRPAGLLTIKGAESPLWVITGGSTVRRRCGTVLAFPSIAGQQAVTRQGGIHEKFDRRIMARIDAGRRDGRRAAGAVQRGWCGHG